MNNLPNRMDIDLSWFGNEVPKFEFEVVKEKVVKTKTDDRKNYLILNKKRRKK